MTVIDAYALISALAEDRVEEIASLFSTTSSPARIATVNLAEVIDVMIRVKKRTLDEVSDRVDALVRNGVLEVVVVDDAIARRAGAVRAATYDKRTRLVSMADCTAAAAAERLEEPLATPDPHLAATAREIGVELTPLPDSSGRRP